MNTYKEVYSYYEGMMSRCEDDCLHQILEQALGRFPVHEDGKNLTLIFNNKFPESYIIAFKGRIIGLLTKSFDFENRKFKCHFEPNKKFFI